MLKSIVLSAFAGVGLGTVLSYVLGMLGITSITNVGLIGFAVGLGFSVGVVLPVLRLASIGVNAIGGGSSIGTGFKAS